MRAIGNWNSSLIELSLCKCTGVTDECLSFLVQSHKELRKLDITCCRKITCASIDSITSSCTSLTSLKMESCSMVSKDAFVLIGQRCQLLEELDVTDNEIDDEGLNLSPKLSFCMRMLSVDDSCCFVSLGLKAISRCSRLCSLKLGICINTTDDGLTHVGSGCSKLKELDLYRYVAFEIFTSNILTC